MDPSNVSMRTGLLGSEPSERDAAARDNFVATSMGLLSVFSEESARTAGKYAIGCGRSEVTDEDMCKALMYEARTFFNNTMNLEERVALATAGFRKAIAKIEDEEDEGGGGGSGNESGSASEDSEDGDDDEVGDDSELESDDDNSEGVDVDGQDGGHEDEGGYANNTSPAACEQVVRAVDIVVARWETFHPEDRVQAFIKDAIDKTRQGILGRAHDLA